MLAIGRALGEGGVVAFDGGVRRPVDGQVVIAVEQMAELQVGEGEVLAGDVAVFGDARLGDVEAGLECLDRRGDGGRVAVGLRDPDDLPEHRAAEIQPDVELGPFGPFVDLGAGRDVVRPERRGTVAAGEIAQDHGGFEQRLVVAVLQHRHEAVGVHRTVIRRVGAAVFVAGIVACRRKPEFGDAPHHHLDIRRIPASPYGQHVSSPRLRSLVAPVMRQGGTLGNRDAGGWRAGDTTLACRGQKCSTKGRSSISQLQAERCWSISAR